MRFFAGLVAATLMLCLGLGAAHADRRVALVIGNSTYMNLPNDQQPKTAVNDARAVGAALGRLGFEVIAGENLSYSELNAKVDELTRKLSPGDMAFVYFAGHGVSLGSGNYLLPSDVPDVEGGQEGLLARSALSEDDVVTEIQARGARVAVVVLDACRNNPFKRSNKGLIGGEQGLSRIEPLRPTVGVLKLYSAGIGQSALDRLNSSDSNPNSVFTRVLVSELEKPGFDLATLAKQVGKEVQRLALTVDHKQQPAYYNKIVDSVYFAEAPACYRTPERSTHGGSTGSDAAQRAWMEAKDAASIAVLEQFVGRYGDSFYDSLALARIAELKKTEVAAAVPPETEAILAAILRLPDAVVRHRKSSRAEVPEMERLPDAIGGQRLRAAALRGEPAAVYEIGLRFLQGKGVPVNYLKAAVWFRRAEQAGVTPAAFQLGVLYEKGRGVDMDADKAMIYYLEAAEGGNAVAMHNLASLEAASGNPVSAAEWFLKAANRGVRDSQFNLAVLYYRGAGVKRDLGESYKWFSLSAAQGDPEAMDRRNDVAMRLNDVALASAERAVKEFVVEPQADEAVGVPLPADGRDEAEVKRRRSGRAMRAGARHR